MSQSIRQRTCIITGATGYVGGCVKRAFARHGWEVLALNRRAGCDPPAPPDLIFRLGDDVPPERLSGATALVHCAYDFQQTSWRDVYRINVQGSEKLFRAAHGAGIERLVFISTLSAFDGCRSLYGQAKLEIERVALAYGALVLRPGLVYGDAAGGMFGKLAHQVGRSTLVPLVGGGSQVFYLIHEEDLSELIYRYCEGWMPPVNQPVPVAHDQGLTLREVLETIGRADGKRLTFLPIPWRPVWAVLRLGELLGVQWAFRSDSVQSLMSSNAAVTFELARSLGFRGRPFRPESLGLHAPRRDARLSASP